MLLHGRKQGEAVCVHGEQGSLMANVSDAAALLSRWPGISQCFFARTVCLGSKERSNFASFGLHNRPRPYAGNTH